MIPMLKGSCKGNSMDEKIIHDEADSEIIDLDGEPFISVGELEYEGETYVALTPYNEEEDEEDEVSEDGDEEAEFVILREVEENGEYFLATIDDDELYDKIGEMFLEVFENGE